MPATDPREAATFTERVRHTLQCYDEALLRHVAGRLLRPRSHWPADEVIDRCVDTLSNAPVIDRRLKDLPPASRKALAVIGLSRQPLWRVGHVLNLLAVLGDVEGLTPIQALFDSGFAYPDLPESSPPLKSFEEWLGGGGILQSRFFVAPVVAARARGEDLGLPALESAQRHARPPRVDDGLEWPLRTAVAWQQILAGPLRLTQQNALFKRDLQRLQTDPLLSGPLANHSIELPEAGVLALELATASGMLRSEAGELRAADLPAPWDEGLLPLLASLFAALPWLEGWDPLKGYHPAEAESPFPSVALAVLLLLRQLPPADFAAPKALAAFIAERHPSWMGGLKNKPALAAEWAQNFLAGVAYPLRLVELTDAAGGPEFRLSDLGRHLLDNGPAPQLEHGFLQTLVVQPNGEVIAYRQGLTPDLIARLTRFAAWKTLGAACTLELTAESVYRGLETGLSLREILQMLQQRGSRALPATVLDSLQRWSNKRERIVVYPAATLVEFATPGDLDAAFAQGLVASKLTDRLGLVEEGAELDYRHFRLIGNRDYEARPQQCVRFEPDGVTFTVDAISSDLLLEAELSRLAQPLEAEPGQRRFELTPASLKAAQARGLSLAELEEWGLLRSGEPLSPAARLLYMGSGGVPGSYRESLVLHLPGETVTDGVVQWPATARYVEQRLGPSAVTVTRENLDPLRRELEQLGIEVGPG